MVRCSSSCFALSSLRSVPPMPAIVLRQRSFCANFEKWNCDRMKAAPGPAAPTDGGSHCSTSSAMACSACTQAEMSAMRARSLGYHSHDCGKLRHAARNASSTDLALAPGTGCDWICASIAAARLSCRSVRLLMRTEDAMGMAVPPPAPGASGRPALKKLAIPAAPESAALERGSAAAPPRYYYTAGASLTMKSENCFYWLFTRAPQTTRNKEAAVAGGWGR